MSTQTRRAKTGFIGEFYIYSELLRQDKNCFITLGNAKSVDLIIIDDKKQAFYVDVKSTNTEMNNLHKHSNYDKSVGKIGKWQLTIKRFWDTHPINTQRTMADFPDFYIFTTL